MMFMWAMVAALAGQIEIFPEKVLGPEELEALLVPSLIGPPSQRYDQSSHTGAGASALELEVEKALRVSWDRDVPDGLRCWADQFNRARRAGALSKHAEAFLAEHCGLVTPPWAATLFFTDSGEARHSAQMLRDTVAALQGGEELGPWAVSVIFDERTLVYHGVLATMEAPVAFEPFARASAPGGMLHVPGVVLSKRRAYELFVTRPGTRVDSWRLEAGDDFDVEIPLPAEPGVWHVAVAEYQKNRFADSPFYFSLYAGAPLPTTYHALRPAPSPVGLTAEEAVVFQVNQVRAGFGLPPFVLAGDPARIREALASLPANEPAAVRVLRKVFSEDPLPGEAHGRWSGGMAAGAVCSESGLLLVENPVTRLDLLSDRGGSFVSGAWLEGGRCRVLAMVVDEAADGGGVREEARAALWEVWPGTKPVPAPKLEAALDLVAADLASGALKPGRSSKPVMQRLDALGIPGSWTVQVVYVAPDSTPDVSGFAPPSGGGHLAIGRASGDLGGQPVTYTVLLLVRSGGDLP
jgi:hypothetical protein